MAAKIVMYSKTTCPYCHRAESVLRDHGVADEDLDLIQIDIDRSRRDEMIKLAQRSTVPQIFIDGRHIGGCDDLVALDRAGGLEPLLKAS